MAATAAELEEALQEVSRRGARIDALTCEVAWYRCACCRLVQVCVLPRHQAYSIHLLAAQQRLASPLYIKCRGTVAWTVSLQYPWRKSCGPTCM